MRAYLPDGVTLEGTVDEVTEALSHLGYGEDDDDCDCPECAAGNDHASKDGDYSATVLAVKCQGCGALNILANHPGL